MTRTVKQEKVAIKKEILKKLNDSGLPVGNGHGYMDIINRMINEWHAVMIEENMPLEEFLLIIQKSKADDYHARTANLK